MKTDRTVILASANGKSVEVPASLYKHSTYIADLKGRNKNASKRLPVGVRDVRNAEVIKSAYIQGQWLLGSRAERKSRRQTVTLIDLYKALKHYGFRKCPYELQCWFVNTVAGALLTPEFPTKEELDRHPYFTVANYRPLEEKLDDWTPKALVEMYEYFLLGAPARLCFFMKRDSMFEHIKDRLMLHLDLHSARKYLMLGPHDKNGLVAHAFYTFAMWYCLMRRQDCVLVGLCDASKNVKWENGELVVEYMANVLARYMDCTGAATGTGITTAASKISNDILESVCFLHDVEECYHASAMKFDKINLKVVESADPGVVKMWFVGDALAANETLGMYLEPGLWFL